jgi:hypothetical protein
VLPQISLDPVDWFEFQQAAEDNPAIRILGHDSPCDGRLNVYRAAPVQAVIGMEPTELMQRKGRFPPLRRW